MRFHTFARPVWRHRKIDRRIARLCAVVGLAALIVVPGLIESAHADDTVIIQPSGVEPPVLHTTTGTRVEFANRTGRAVHLEFEGSRRLHEIVQNPTTGPFWVVFHEPGTHRYVVHVYETKERSLPGTVEVTADPRSPSPGPGCGVAVLGVCVEK